MSYSVAPYHWDDRSRVPRDLDYVGAVYEALLPKLASALNQIHGTDFSVRYWRIVVGWWLFYFTQIFFDRWHVIKGASEAYPEAKMLRLRVSYPIPASANMSQFLVAMASDSWNERILADIAERWSNIQVTEVDGTAPQDPVPIAVADRATSRWARTKLSHALQFLGRQRLFFGAGVVIGRDCFSRWERLKLAALLGQIPSIGIDVKLPNTPPNPAYRNWALAADPDDDFTDALATLVPQYLPTCYLEDFGEMSRLSTRRFGSVTPKVIVTASAFEADDACKVWTAQQCERGTKLVVGQHGGHYGAGAWSASQTHEVAISDRFLTWGWTDAQEPKICRAPAAKLIGLRRQQPRTIGYCLHVTSSLPMQSYWMYSVPIGPQFNGYIDDQLLFASALSAGVRKDLLVRLYPHEHGWEIGDRWRDAEPRIATDAGGLDLRKLLSETKLYVATYNATTFLESFTRGIPTVMFWNPKYWELSEEAAPFYDALRRASVLFDDPYSCANHVNSIWEDVPTWWSSVQVQSAVEEFCENFAYIGKRPLREFKDALTTWPSP